MSKKVKNQVKLTNKEKECVNNHIDVMLDWNDIMQNNPTFDQVYDYISEVYSAWGHKLDVNNEYDRKFIQVMCELTKVSK
jgi:hypothetical protein